MVWAIRMVRRRRHIVDKLIEAVHGRIRTAIRYREGFSAAARDRHLVQAADDVDWIRTRDIVTIGRRRARASGGSPRSINGDTCSCRTRAIRFISMAIIAGADIRSVRMDGRVDFLPSSSAPNPRILAETRMMILGFRATPPRSASSWNSSSA